MSYTDFFQFWHHKEAHLKYSEYNPLKKFLQN